MQQLLNFFFKNRTLILFLFLLSISFGLTINSQDYQKSKFINSSAWVSGSIHTLFSDIGDYFYLKRMHFIGRKQPSEISRIFAFYDAFRDFEFEKRLQTNPGNCGQKQLWIFKQLPNT